MHEAEYPLLDWAAAEGGVYNEELATLGNLVVICKANIYAAQVLRYVFDRGGRRRPIELPFDKMGASPWINCSEKTVRRAVEFWEKLDIMEIGRDRRDEWGRQLPPSGRLCWSSVLQQLLGGAASMPAPASAVSPARIESPVDRSGRGFLQGLTVPTQGLTVPTQGLTVPTQGLTVPTQGLTVLLKPPPLQNSRYISALARARGLLSLSLSIVVVDDNLREEVPFVKAWELADEARQVIWPSRWPRDPAVKQIFVRGAVLGVTLFEREWVLAASRATKAKRPDTPSSYWVGSLRNGLVESQGFPEFESLATARSYISQLMHAVSGLADEIIAECGNGELLAVAAPQPQAAIDREAERQRALASWGPGGARRAFLENRAAQTNSKPKED